MFSVNSLVHTLSIAATLANSFYVGYQTGGVILKAQAGVNLLSAEMIGSMAEIALSIIPLNYLTKIRHLSKVAVAVEKIGFSSVIFDTNKNVKGFKKVYHWVQRLYARGFTPEQALMALSRGSTWRDVKSGAIAKVLCDARKNGTIKIIFDKKGRIVTVLKDKLIRKFVPYE